MKKRIVAVLCTVIFCLQMFPIGRVQAAKAKPEHIAYNKIVQNIIDQYGYADGHGGDGLVSVALLDFNQDGVDELAVASSKASDTDIYQHSIAFSLYRYNNGSPVLIHSSNDQGITIGRNGNMVYLCPHNGRGHRRSIR